MTTIILTFVLAAFISAMMSPISIKLAHLVGALDVPTCERKIHKKATPRIGGISFIIGFFVSSIVALGLTRASSDINPLMFFIGLALISVIGFTDDIYNLKARHKLLGQVVAAILAISSGLRICYITIPLITFPFLNDMLINIVTFFWIIGVTNAVNLIDGLDGLASGITIFAVLSLLVIFILIGASEFAVILLVALLGAMIGFLPYNSNPAKTFMGDVGSNFLGYCLATFPMIGMMQTHSLLTIIIPIIVLGLPVFDTLFAIIRRLAHHKSIMEADRGHLHHRLMDAGFSQKQAVIIMYSITAILGSIAIAIIRIHI